MNYNRPPVNIHRLLGLVGLSILLVATRAYADGAYQRTEDRKKALVWNNDPKPGDAATWTGQHDSDGYATGSGTLTWYRVDRGFTTGSNIAVARKKTPISSYSGTMVRGKFNGAVTTIDHGKTFHANFADGQRKGGWTSGPVVAKAERAEPSVAVKKAQPTESEISTPVATGPVPVKSEKVGEAKTPPAVAEQTTEDIPAAGPTERKVEGGKPNPEGAESTATESTKPATPLIAQAQVPDQSSTPRQPVTKKAALAPGAVHAIDRPTESTARKTEPVPTKSQRSDQPAKTVQPAPSQPTEVQADAIEQIPAEGPVEEIAKPESPTLKSESPALAKSAPAAKETPVDDSIRSLIGPPSSLRSKPPKSDANPPAPSDSPEPAMASTSEPDGPKLTAVEAMDIADIEARTRGYDLGEYQLPKADYSATNDTWAVSYVGQPDKTKKLTVSVQDKTGKAEVKK